MKLSATANIETPSYICLEEEGYEVTVIDSVCGRSIAIAKKGAIELVGNTMLELLGLAALVQKRGESWQATDTETEKFNNKLSCNP